VLATLSLALAAAVLAGRAAGAGDLDYNAYPEVSAPGFAPLFALVYLLPLTGLVLDSQRPVLIRPRRQERSASRKQLPGGADGS
jgi:hypothetical protein